jgi:subtilisin family serine protease
MKKIILFLILASITPGLFAQSDFFYSEKGKMKTFKIRKDRVIFMTKSNNNAVDNKFKSVRSIGNDLNKMEVDPETFDEKDLSDIDGITDWYYMLENIDNGTLVALNNQIFVSPLMGESIERIIQKSGLSGKIEKLELFFPKAGLYLLTLDCKMKDILSVCRQIYKTGMVDCADPDFYMEGLLGNALWNNQWNLKNTGQENGTPGIDINVEPAWNEFTRGSSNIKIAIIDEGVDLTHPDLQDNLLTGFDVTYNGSGGSYTGDDVHGTSCAGVIGAINNSIGVVGVASGCKMIPIKAFNIGGGDITQVINGLQNARNAGADIINNSWGYIDDNVSVTLKAAMTATINDCVNLGRNGKGCVVVFCTHNRHLGSLAIRYPAYLPNVIAVGSVTRTGWRVETSNYGPGLDVVAPVGNDTDSICVPTTDLQGDAGVNTASGTAGNYRKEFRGTSAACPQVAGIAALILSRNSNLTAQEVYDIITITARKLDQYIFETTSAHPNGAWNIEVGYGLVDALAAVQAATCTNSFGNQTVSSNRFIRSCNNLNIQGTTTVTNNAKFTVKANEVTTSGTFEVASGIFEIR